MNLSQWGSFWIGAGTHKCLSESDIEGKVGRHKQKHPDLDIFNLLRRESDESALSHSRQGESNTLLVQIETLALAQGAGNQGCSW